MPADQSKWAQPQTLTALQAAFPGSVADLMPSYEEVPAKFKNDHNSWVRVQEEWFFNGLKGDLVAKPGIDKAVAIRHLAAVQSSWEPKHEHKMAGVAYLLSLWFERYEAAA